MSHLSPETSDDTEPGTVTIIVQGLPTVRKPRTLIRDSSSESSAAKDDDNDNGDDGDTVEVSAVEGEREGPGDGEGGEEQDEDELRASKDHLFTVLAHKRMASPAMTAVLTQADRIERHLRAVQQVVVLHLLAKDADGLGKLGADDRGAGFAGTKANVTEESRRIRRGLAAVMGSRASKEESVRQVVYRARLVTTTLHRLLTEADSCGLKEIEGRVAGKSNFDLIVQDYMEFGRHVLRLGGQDPENTPTFSNLYSCCQEIRKVFDDRTVTAKMTAAEIRKACLLKLMREEEAGEPG
ncbi:hypothetical protein HK101_011815, partial [Irineochytrium annulatum]